MNTDRYKVSTKYFRVNPFALMGWNAIFGESIRIPFDEVLGVYYKNSKEFNTFYPYPKGGKVVVTIRDTVTNESYVGSATCSMVDQFCYKTGKALALARAIDKLNG